VTINRETNRTQKTCSHIVLREVHLARTKADDGHFRTSDGVLVAVYPDRVAVYRTDSVNRLLYDPSTRTVSAMASLRNLLPTHAYIAVMAALGVPATGDLDV
jgi:hypothetical protein